MGKSIYRQKLVYDWANKKELDESFPEVELLLLLRCRDIRTDISKQILPEANSP